MFKGPQAMENHSFSSKYSVWSNTAAIFKDDSYHQNIMADGLFSRKAKGKYPCSWSTSHKTDKDMLLPEWLVASLDSVVVSMLNRQGQLDHSPPGVRLQVWPSSRIVKCSQKKTVPRRVFMAVIELVDLSHWSHDPPPPQNGRHLLDFFFEKASEDFNKVSSCIK